MKQQNDKTEVSAAFRGETTIVAERFCGPPQSGNGGYICGLAAELIHDYTGNPVQARIKAPAPLQTELAVIRRNDEVVLSHLGKDLVEVKPVRKDLMEGFIKPPNFDDAQKFSAGYAGFERHYFPRCFVCGPERAAGDGLCIFCGPASHDVVAGTWIPDVSLGLPDGTVAPRYVWAALDCPGGVAALNGSSPRLIVLAKFEVELKRPAKVGDKYVVVGWKKKITGKRNLVGSAIFDTEGAPIAVSEGLWLEATGWEESNQAMDWRK